MPSDVISPAVKSNVIGIQPASTASVSAEMVVLTAVSSAESYQETCTTELLFTSTGFAYTVTLYFSPVINNPGATFPSRICLNDPCTASVTPSLAITFNALSVRPSATLV